MSLEVLAAAALVAALAVYVVTGGADFGGGVWDLLATGPRAGRQRELVARAIAPIWEANHVWLIAAIVLLFACFPIAFVTLSTVLHVPLTLMLIGIVLRGSAFVFRAHDRRGGAMRRRWSLTFAIASLVTPVTFGMCVGAVASGELRADPATGWPRTLDLVGPWTSPFAAAVGLLALALFAFLAATYLTVEAREPDLADDFRTRALMSGIAAAALAAAALALAPAGAPRLFERLARPPGAPWTLAAAGGAALAALAALAVRRYPAARVAAAAFALALIGGWVYGQYPLVVAPDLDVLAAARPAREVLPVVLIGLGAGTLVLAPALVYLFRVFKRG